MNESPARSVYRLRTLPIRAKLAIVSVLVLIALITLPSLSLFHDASLQKINQTRIEISALKSKLLKLQRSQNDFVNLFELKYLDEFSSTFETFVESTENLKEQFWNLDLPITTLEELVRLTSKYQYLFEVMAEQKIIVGQDDSKGIRKDIHENIQSLEVGLDQLRGDLRLFEILQNSVNLMKLSVKELQIHHRKDQINIFENHFQDMLDQINRLVEDKAKRKLLLVALNDYHKNVGKLVAATQKIGMTYGEGINGEIGTIVHTTHQILNRLSTEVDSAILRKEKNINTLLGFMAPFFFVVFILTIILLARSISGPIRGVTSIMTRLADGDLDVHIPSESRRDEVGDMYKALRIFKMGAIIRQRTQHALRTAHDDLEMRVDERTRELQEEIQERLKTEQELLLAREEAESANKAKSMFLANMSHELRTPLNAIIGYAEMLQEDAQDVGNAVMSDDLNKIHSAGRHLLKIISEILDLSKIEAGHIEIYSEKFCVQDALDTVINTVQPLMKTNQNDLRVDIKNDLGFMNSDVTKLRQILFNFLSNAAKFSENKTITLRAKRQELPDGDVFVFSVIDHGIGMNKQQLDRIFAPFTQADLSTTRKYGGTGLGLTINKAFADVLGGEVDVQSSPNKGSTFIVRLPASAPSPMILGEP